MSRMRKMLQSAAHQPPRMPPNIQQAIDKMAANGIPFTPTITEPSGILVLVAFPNGEMRLKAELLPQGHELDYSIGMLETAIQVLHQKRAEQALKDDKLIRKADALPTIVEG